MVTSYIATLLELWNKNCRTNMLTDAILVVYIKMRTVFRNDIHVVVFVVCEQLKVHFVSAIKLMELLLNPWSC